MSPGQATKAAFDLLGQPVKPAPAVRPRPPRLPQLDIAWGSFHQGIGSSLAAIFSRSPVPRKFSLDGFFKDCWIERRIPRRAIVAAALWHIVFLVLPFPQFPARARRYSALDNATLASSSSTKAPACLSPSPPTPAPPPRRAPAKPPTPS